MLSDSVYSCDALPHITQCNLSDTTTIMPIRQYQ